MKKPAPIPPIETTEDNAPVIDAPALLEARLLQIEADIAALKDKKADKIPSA